MLEKFRFEISVALIIGGLSLIATNLSWQHTLIVFLGVILIMIYGERYSERNKYEEKRKAQTERKAETAGESRETNKEQ